MYIWRSLLLNISRLFVLRCAFKYIKRDWKLVLVFILYAVPHNHLTAIQFSHFLLYVYNIKRTNIHAVFLFISPHQTISIVLRKKTANNRESKNSERKRKKERKNKHKKEPVQRQYSLIVVGYKIIYVHIIMRPHLNNTTTTKSLL